MQDPSNESVLMECRIAWAGREVAPKFLQPAKDRAKALLFFPRPISKGRGVSLKLLSWWEK